MISTVAPSSGARPTVPTAAARRRALATAEQLGDAVVLAQLNDTLRADGSNELLARAVTSGKPVAKILPDADREFAEHFGGLIKLESQEGLAEKVAQGGGSWSPKPGAPHPVRTLRFENEPSRADLDFLTPRRRVRGAMEL